MSLFDLNELAAATVLVRRFIPATPAYTWPLLKQQTGINLVVKHENHTPTGSFKARGGLVFMEALCDSADAPRGVVTATRGNHGQSIAFAAQRRGLEALIVVPEGNSTEKNAAMEAFGGTLVVAGRDFDESRITAQALADERGFTLVPSFHRDLVLGVATYARELFEQVQGIDKVYVPIGMGSGACALITVRDLLGLETEIIGVVSTQAPAFALSLAAGEPVATESARTFADGMACRDPQKAAFDIVQAGIARIVEVSDDEVADAVRLYYSCTHNLAEGAGAAPLAAAIKDQARRDGDRVATVLCGGNIDAAWMCEVLSGRTPEP